MLSIIESIDGLRTVGHTMATNPLYPLVPCHRVVGTDLGLVGYGGRQDEAALRSRLDRLKSETRSLATRDLLIEGGSLGPFPVELAVARAENELLSTSVRWTFSTKAAHSVEADRNAMRSTSDLAEWLGWAAAGDLSSLRQQPSER